LALNNIYKGDYATALREWTPLAEQGHAKAQTILGAMYKEGKGVPKDIVYAHMCKNLGYSNDSKNGDKLRDLARPCR
jgi:TPR repeat protein